MTAKLGDEKLKTKLIGLQINQEIKKIYLIRPTPLNIAKVTNVNPAAFIAKSRFLFEIWRLFQLLHLMSKKENKIVVGIQFFLHGFMAVIAAKVFRKSAVVWLIGSDVMIYGQRQVVKWFFARTIGMCDAVLVMGTKMRSYLRDIQQSKIYEMQSFIDPEVYYPRESVVKEWDVGFVGNLVEVKNVEVILRAIAVNENRGRKYKTIIVGEGALHENLKRLSKELGISDIVRFVGARNDVSELIQRIRLVALSSKSEGLPAILLESAFCGVPSLSSNVGEVAQTFENYSCCKIVDSCTPEIYADAIEYILSSPEVEKGMCLGALDFKEDYLRLWGAIGQKNRWASVIDFSLR